jgi:hypothetical protein
LVASGQVRSRTSLVERAFAHEIRRLETERDIAILRSGVTSSDLQSLEAWAARSPRPDVD